jgi:LysM repeat protein
MRRSAAALVLALLLPLPGLAGEVVVKPGETLSEIAERYGVSVQRLMQLNGLKDAKDLWAGSRIQVPGAGSASPGRTGSSSSGAGNYPVKPGETLSEIAERYGVSVQRLMQLNGLKDAKDLWAGSRIQVPGTATTARPTAAKPAVKRNAKEHKVMPGETLSEIADLYGVPMERLTSLNGLATPNALMAGTTLKLRSATAPKPAAKPVAAKPAATKPVAAKPVATKPAVKPAIQSTAQPVATKPVVQQTPQVQPVAAAPKPAAAKPVAAKPSTPDWRSYGPLQVDWANWQPMGGSCVAPSLNSDGQPLYLAINCSARRLNATGQSGTWKSWDAPQSDFEEQLITDLCKAKQS